MIDILREVANGTTYKTVLQQQMAKYNLEKTMAAQDIIRSILSDSIIDYNNLRNWLDNLGGIRADEEIIASYIEESNFNDATILAGMMPALYNLTGKDLTEHNYYLEMLNLTMNLKQEGRTVFDLDSTEVDFIVDISNNSIGIAGAQAKAILESGYGYSFCRCLDVDSTQGYKSAHFSLEELSRASGLEISVEPNPATTWTAFNYTLPDNQSSGTIKITDISGKTIELKQINGKQGQWIWDTRNVINGIYLYSIEVGNYKLTDKIIVRN